VDEERVTLKAVQTDLYLAVGKEKQRLVPVLESEPFEFLLKESDDGQFLLFDDDTSLHCKPARIYFDQINLTLAEQLLVIASPLDVSARVQSESVSGTVSPPDHKSVSSRLEKNDLDEIWA
jgi:hypothetical protein